MHYHFEGRLTTRDCKQYIPHRFTVPAGSTQLDLHLRFAPAGAFGIVNLVTLTLFDPAGFRGAGLRAATWHHAHVEAGTASPGYLPGPLPGGEWLAEIDTHMIMPGEPVHYTLDVALADGSGPTPRAASLPDRRALQPDRGPGWYRGDLHTHTHHSDGGERSVAELIEAARDAGLDFLFLTDHNTTAGLAEMDACSAPDLLAAGGIELTTYWGHAVVLGTRDWIDWRARPGTGQMGGLAADAYARGHLFIIAHPMSPGDPACTGCTWRFGDMMPGNARLVEVWNGPWCGDSNNEAALALWYDWLNQGHHLVATAGTDTHGPQDYRAQPGLNVVYASALSEAALLEALLAGHLYLSAGPTLSFSADPGTGQVAIAGDTITQPANLAVTWADCPPDAYLRLVADGRRLHLQPAGEHGEHRRRVAPGEAAWVVAEIRAEKGELLAITNPIFMQAERDERHA